MSVSDFWIAGATDGFNPENDMMRSVLERSLWQVWGARGGGMGRAEGLREARLWLLGWGGGPRRGGQ